MDRQLFEVGRDVLTFGRHRGSRIAVDDLIQACCHGVSTMLFAWSSPSHQFSLSGGERRRVFVEFLPHVNGRARPRRVAQLESDSVDRP